MEGGEGRKKGMGKRTFRIWAAVLSAVIAALVWLNVGAERKETWDVCYEMVNARIEWTGAGYDGIWARGQ